MRLGACAVLLAAAGCAGPAVQQWPEECETPEAVEHLVCRSYAARSLAPCRALPSRPPHLAHRGGEPDPVVPQGPRENCVQLTRRAWVMEALIAGSGPAVCAANAELYVDIEPGRREAMCRALTSYDCEGASRAAGGFDERRRRICRELTSLKGAPDEAACGTSLPEPELLACRTVQRARAGKGCPRPEVLRGRRCAGLIGDATLRE